MAHHDIGSHASPDDGYRETPAGAQHEYTDAAVRPIVKLGIWLAVATVLVHFGMGFVFSWLSSDRTEGQGQRRFPVAVEDGMRLPALPRLQGVPLRDITEHRILENEQLEGYGWVDREAGTVRIPIEEAMRLVVERGLPALEQASETPGLMPADASAGATMVRRRQ
ncbi:MAG: hypothetical protein AB7G23_11860 [Vicinamibacterales bacterium]